MTVLAAPGVGKSAFALEWAACLDKPSLYISLDTSLTDQAIRLLARSTGLTVEQVTEGHDQDLDTWASRWEAQVSSMPYRARFCDITQTTRTIGELISAEAEYLGEPPALTIIDNTFNLIEQEESAGEYERIFGELKKVAREFNTLVVCLHHLKRRPSKPRGKQDEEEDSEATLPVHLTDGVYGCEKQSNFVLGLWRTHPTKLRVGVLKNRMGPASSTGTMHITLNADLRRMRIEQPANPERYLL